MRTAADDLVGAVAPDGGGACSIGLSGIIL
jgi:hypothetical protein